MKIALIQQCASADRAANRSKGLDAVEKAARQGAQLICIAELAFEPFYPQEPATAGTIDLAEPIPGPTTEAFVCDPGGRVIARAGKGTEEILFCDIDLDMVQKSHARKLFIRDRRPDLYGDWLE